MRYEKHYPDNKLLFECDDLDTFFGLFVDDDIKILCKDTHRMKMIIKMIKGYLAMLNSDELKMKTLISIRNDKRIDPFKPYLSHFFKQLRRICLHPENTVIGTVPLLYNAIHAIKEVRAMLFDTKHRALTEDFKNRRIALQKEIDEDDAILEPKKRYIKNVLIHPNNNYIVCNIFGRETFVFKNALDLTVRQELLWIDPQAFGWNAKCYLEIEIESIDKD